MLKLFVHIGYHKTGTSAIQSFLWQNRKALRARGLLFPKATLTGHSHSALANSLKRANVVLDPVVLYAQMASEATRSKCPRVVVSSECFMEGVDPARVRGQLDPALFEVKVVVYLRRQDTWIQSVYNQVVKDDMRRYTGSIPELREVRMGGLDYEKVLEPWAEAFGTENVIVRAFEKLQMSGGLYRDFLSAVETETEGPWVLPEGEARNRGLNRDVLEFLRACNHLTMMRDQHARLVDALQAISEAESERDDFSEYDILAPAERQQILQTVADSNRRVARRYLGRSELFLESPSGDDAGWAPYAGLSRERQYELLGKLPAEQRRLIGKLCRRVSSGERFLPPTNLSESDRLRRVIMRQRRELAHLYYLVDKLGGQSLLDEYP